MKDLMENWQRFLVESSLSRIICRHINQYDNAIITAFRDDTEIPEKKGERARDRKRRLRVANRKRNRELKAQLWGLNPKPDITQVAGSSVEDWQTPLAKEVREDSFMVHNVNHDPKFEKKIAKLGEFYNQDSILIIPQGGAAAYLLGTKPEGEFPPYKEQLSVGDLKAGCEAEFMSRVSNRPFTFSENTESYKALSRNSKWAVKKIVERIKREKAAKNPPKS